MGDMGIQRRDPTKTGKQEKVETVCLKWKRSEV